MPRHAIPIPAHIPEDNVCVQVSVPNSPEFIQMFYDALSRLSHTRNYARDDSKSGKMLADVWVNRTLSPLLEDLVNQSGCTSVILNCDDVNDCLETSPVIAGINQNLVRYSAPTNVFIDATTHVTPDNANVSNPLGDPVPDTIEEPNLCKDSLWSGCYSVSTMLHNQNMDFLERTSAITGNNLRKITGLIDMIPIVGAVVDELVIADLIDFIALMAGDMYVQYESIVTDDLIAETACAYFAMGCSDCSVPTFQQILDYHESFITGLSFDNATTTLIDIISLFVTGSFASNQWYHAMTWFQLWVLLAEETFLQKRGTGWIAFAYKLGANSPDNDWTLWCDECEPEPPAGYFYNWVASAEGWVMGENTRWGSVYQRLEKSAGVSARYGMAYIDYETPITVSFLKMYHNHNAGREYRVTLFDSSLTQIAQWSHIQNTQRYDYEQTYTIAGTGVKRIQVEIFRIPYTASTDNWTIEWLSVNGVMS